MTLPKFLYGTAWKEDATQPCVTSALAAGFRGIDTANQRKHYHEGAVGEAITRAVAEGVVKREEMFLQTKFTYQNGQDHRLPFNPSAPPAIQVAQSLASLYLPRLMADILHLERSFDTGLVATFTDRDALERYTIHDEHQKVAAIGKQIAEKVVSVDFLSGD